MEKNPVRVKSLSSPMLLGVVIVCLSLSGCASLMSSAASGLADNLSAAVLNQNDPGIVRDGAPSYLLLLDSFLEGNPDSPELLSSAATLYATYGAVFADDAERARRLTERAVNYSERAICIEYAAACDWQGKRFEEYEPTLSGLREKHADVILSHGLSSLAYIRAHSGDYSAIALLPYTQALLQRYLQLSDGSNDATVHVYMGVLDTLLPPALGGKPESGKAHFERAIELSDGKDLSAKLEYANSYARLMYDRELHDRLLNEVLNGEESVPGLTLTNVMAKQQAEDLLATADDYF